MPQVWLEKQVMNVWWRNRQKQLELMSEDLILGDYLIYWLVGKFDLLNYDFLKCSLGGNILLG